MATNFILTSSLEKKGEVKELLRSTTGNEYTVEAFYKIKKDNNVWCHNSVRYHFEQPNLHHYYFSLKRLRGRRKVQVRPKAFTSLFKNLDVKDAKAYKIDEISEVQSKITKSLRDNLLLTQEIKSMQDDLTTIKDLRAKLEIFERRNSCMKEALKFYQSNFSLKDKHFQLDRVELKQKAVMSDRLTEGDEDLIIINYNVAKTIDLTCNNMIVKSTKPDTMIKRFDKY